MRKASIISLFAVCLLAVSFPACKKKEDPAKNDNVVNGFDKTAMLANYADNIIIPEYKALDEELALLETAAKNFVDAPSGTTQQTLLAAYKNAHLQYERVAAFQFGPAETRLLDAFLNYSGGLDNSFGTSGQLAGFSTDTATIESNISAGSWNLASMTRNSFYSQGFPALNYLFFAPLSINSLETNKVVRGKYITDVVTRMRSLTQGVSADWVAYRSEFTANTKTSVGSPIGNIVNQLAMQMDVLKGPRIGWPLGMQSNGTAFPGKCEAYYSGISGKLAVENLTALKRLYTAQDKGKGISGYLIALGKSSLDADVLTQFDITLAALNAIPDPLSATIASQPALVDAAYKEIQKLLTLLKTDVASATAVQINFTDNDGD